MRSEMCNYVGGVSTVRQYAPLLSGFYCCAVNSVNGTVVLRENAWQNPFIGNYASNTRFGGYNGDCYTDRAGRPWGHNGYVGMRYQF